MKRIARYDGQGWAFAPWGDGGGGVYSEVSDGDVLDYLSILQPEPHSHYVVTLDADGYPDDALILEVATKARHKDRVTVGVPGRGAIDITGYPSHWIANLADSDQVPLSVVELEGALTLVWLGDGGLDGWIRGRRGADSKRQRAKLTAALSEKHDSGDFFVNPYTRVLHEMRTDSCSGKGLQAVFRVWWV